MDSRCKRGCRSIRAKGTLVSELREVKRFLCLLTDTKPKGCATRPGADSFWEWARQCFSCQLIALFYTLGIPGQKAEQVFMRVLPRVVFVAAIPLALGSSGPELAGFGRAATRSKSTMPPAKPTVYVSDFEIDVLPPPPGSRKPEDDPRRQASRLVELMSTKLLAALQKAGYPAVRMREGDARPDKGVAIRGLFAEVDDENHWRRALIRTATDSGKMEALVEVATLAKPDQALYEIAPLPGNDNNIPGAVITLSPYVPLTKYDLNKDAKEDVFQKIAPRVVDDLTALLSANPAAISE